MLPVIPRLAKTRKGSPTQFAAPPAKHCKRTAKQIGSAWRRKIKCFQLVGILRRRIVVTRRIPQAITAIDKDRRRLSFWLRSLGITSPIEGTQRTAKSRMADVAQETYPTLTSVNAL